MATICAGHGGPHAKPAYPLVVTMTSAAVEAAIVEATAGVASWLAAGVIAGVTLELLSVCSLDPPSDPGITEQDLLDASGTGNTDNQQAAVAKLTQWFLSWYWYTVCECSDGTSPGSAPVLSAPPTTGQDPGLPAGPSASSCGQTNHPSFQIFTTGQSDTLFSGSFGPMPAGATSVTCQFSSVGNNVALTITTIQHNAQGTQIATNTEGVISTATGGLTITRPLQPGCTDIALSYQYSGTMSSSARFTWTAQAWCGTTPGALTQACCPPDQTLSVKLNQILNLVQEIYSIIPVRVPNYVAGTAHSALSGLGAVSLDVHTIAVKVVFSALPHVTTEILSQPPTYLELGWITPETNQGPEGGLRLTRTTEVVALPEATTILNYSFPPGGVATITELQAG